VDTTRIPQPHRDEHDHQDECPHACNDGWTILGQLVVDPETGEEIESTRFTSAASVRSEARA
jgi:hypothetical protein